MRGGGGSANGGFQHRYSGFPLAVHLVGLNYGKIQSLHGIAGMGFIRAYMLISFGHSLSLLLMSYSHWVFSSMQDQIAPRA